MWRGKKDTGYLYKALAVALLATIKLLTDHKENVIVWRVQIHAKVAQSVEHSTENAGVVGSIPSLGTTSVKQGEKRSQRQKAWYGQEPDPADVQEALADLQNIRLWATQ